MTLRCLLIWPLLLVCALTVVGCGSSRRNEVVVIAKTNTYHTDECPRVNMANAKIMTIAEAEALKCKPCKGCRPGAGR